MSEVKKEGRAGSTERLLAGVFLTIVGLIGFAGGFGMMGFRGFGMMGPGMMGGYGCGYPPFFGGFNVFFGLVSLVFLGVALLGIYLIYDAVRR